MCSLLRVSPSRLEGRLRIPPSKSHTMRALLFAAMAQGYSRIHDPLISPDTDAMVAALRMLGARIRVEERLIEVEGGLSPTTGVIEAGNSGQVLRFIAALAALFPIEMVIRGDHSKRPVEALIQGLTTLGAMAEAEEGYAPIRVCGPIRPGITTLAGADSQPVSALLMATSFLDGPSEIMVTDPGERPWIDLTLFWIRRFGGRVDVDNYERYLVSGGLVVKPFELTIPGDYSSAAFPYIASRVMQSEIILDNLDPEDVQGDKKLFALLDEASIDVNDLIDALPILAVWGCFRERPLEIIGAGIARAKESDRLHAITTELRKMGAKIEEREEGLLIQPASLRGAFLRAHRDHRIAMALTIAALHATGDSYIEGVECIAKSYPTFIRDFQSIGAKITLHSS